MLQEFLKKENIKLNVEVETWQEALRVGGQLLVDSKLITPKYIEDMIQAVIDFGPYIAITPHIALGHAAPSAEVLEESMSLITLKQPVNFNHAVNDPIDVVFIFGATDSSGHLKAISSLAYFLSDDMNYQRLSKATEVEEVVAMIANY